MLQDWVVEQRGAAAHAAAGVGAGAVLVALGLLGVGRLPLLEQLRRAVLHCDLDEVRLLRAVRELDASSGEDLFELAPRLEADLAVHVGCRRGTEPRQHEERTAQRGAHGCNRRAPPRPGRKFSQTLAVWLSTLAIVCPTKLSTARSCGCSNYKTIFGPTLHEIAVDETRPSQLGFVAYPALEGSQ